MPIIIKTILPKTKAEKYEKKFSILFTLKKIWKMMTKVILLGSRAGHDSTSHGSFE